MKKTTALFLSSLFIVSLSGCAKPSADLSKAKQYANNEYMDFTKVFPDQGFSFSSGYSNSASATDPFGVTWDKNQISGEYGAGLTYAINKTDDLSKIKNSKGQIDNTLDPYLGAELRTVQSFRYGFFGGVMKPSDVTGTVTTLFTYTGPSEENPHDEIDIEFLGKDTTKVQFNYYAGNDIGHEFMYDLGFDASKEYHHYGFYWGENEITWYVDYQPVYRYENIVTPSHPSKLMTSFWRASSKSFNGAGWAGQSKEEDFPAYSYFKSLDISKKDGSAMSYIPKGALYEVPPQEGELESVRVAIQNKSAEYSVTELENNSFDVTYENILASTYKNIHFTINDQTFKDKKFLQMKIENKGEMDTKIRLSINSSKGSSDFLEIKKAWLDGEESNITYSGDQTLCYVVIPSGSTKTFAVHFYGLDASSFYMMIDSTSRGSDEPKEKSGHLVLSEWMIGGKQDYDGEDESDLPPEIFPGEGEENNNPLDQYTKQEVEFTFNDAYGIELTVNDDKSVLIHTLGTDGYAAAVISPFSRIKSQVTGSIVGLGFELKSENNFESSLCIISRDASKNKTMDSSLSYGEGAVRFERSGGTGEYFKLAASGEGVLQIGLAGDNTNDVKFFVDSASSTAKESSVTVKKVYVYFDTNSSTGGEEGDETTPKELKTMYKFASNNYYTVTETSEGEQINFTNTGYNNTDANNLSSFALTNPGYALITIRNNNEYAYPISIYYRASSNADGANSGEVVSSTTNETTYNRYSTNNGAYFNLGANDTAVLKVNLTGVPIKVRLILNINNPSITEGSLTILNWKTIEA